MNPYGNPPPPRGSPSPQPHHASPSPQQGAGTGTSPSVSTTAAAASSAAGGAVGPLASTAKIPFIRMCQLFERIGEAKQTKAQQLALLERLWKDMRGATPNDYFQVLRLLMPQLDSKRAVYGLKESKIARFYIELLGLSDTSPDAVKFRHWKDPSRSSVETTIFSDAVFVMLTKRGFGATSPHNQVAGVGMSGGGNQNGNNGLPTSMSVRDVNNALDALAAAHNPNDKKTILFQLLRYMCAVEHKWLIRIIMKEMKIHLAQNPILGAFHPNALELFNSTNDLEHVCEKCLDPKALEEVMRTAAGGAKVYLMRPFKPMLASVVASDKLNILLEGERLLVEPKYDGERILLHFDSGMGSGAQQQTPSSTPQQGTSTNTAGISLFGDVGSSAPPHQQQRGTGGFPTPKVMYWSRNAKNSTPLYAPKFDPVIASCINWEGADAAAAQLATMQQQQAHAAGASRSSVTPTNPTTIAKPSIVVNNCVLDGELLLYDKEKKQFVDFGSNRTFAREGRGADWGRKGDGGAPHMARHGNTLTIGGASSGGLLAGFQGRLTNSDDPFGGGKANKDNDDEPNSPTSPNALLSNPNRYCFQYQVFDIVFLNGECLCNTSLERRKELLARVLREKRNEVHIVPTLYVKTHKDILQALDRALAQRHEGILIKVAASHYVPAERKLKWMKLKPDHISGMADTIDFIILGAYYGTKYRTRHLSHFLLGCYVDDGDGQHVGSGANLEKQGSGKGGGASAPAIGVKRERDADGNPLHPKEEETTIPKLDFADKRARFHTVCKVGTGYDEAELRELNDMLEGKWISLPAGSPAPPWLDGWRPQSGEVPDVYIHPKASAVMEVYGFSITESVKFRFGSTIRFPRCSRIRYDKGVEDATTTSELRKIAAASSHADLAGTMGVNPFGGVGLMGTNLLTSRKAGDMETIVTMKELKKHRREGGVKDDATARAKKNMKGEGDFGGSTAPRKTLVFASRTIVAPAAGSVQQQSDLFSGYEMCVLQSNIEVMERHSLERLLMAHGAQIVSNPQEQTSVILASSRNHVRVQNWVDACTNSAGMVGKYATTDIVNVSWALDSIARAELLPLVPSNTVYASPTLQEQFRKILDPFHDGFFTDCTREELQHSLRRVVRSGANGQLLKRMFHGGAEVEVATVGDDNDGEVGSSLYVDQSRGATTPPPPQNHPNNHVNNEDANDDVVEILRAKPTHAASVEVSPSFPAPIARLCELSGRVAALKAIIREEYPLTAPTAVGDADGRRPCGDTPATDAALAAILERNFAPPQGVLLGAVAVAPTDAMMMVSGGSAMSALPNASGKNNGSARAYAAGDALNYTLSSSGGVGVVGAAAMPPMVTAALLRCLGDGSVVPPL